MSSDSTTPPPPTMNLAEFLRAGATLKRIMSIRATLANLSEEDLVLADRFLSLPPSAADQWPQAVRNQITGDIRTFLRILMFFRSEVATRCMAKDELLDLMCSKPKHPFTT